MSNRATAPSTGYTILENRESGRKRGKTPVDARIQRTHIGDGKAIFLPKSRIDLLEEEHGQIKHVAIEVDGELTIRPIIKTKALRMPKRTTY